MRHIAVSLYLMALLADIRLSAQTVNVGPTIPQFEVASVRQQDKNEGRAFMRLPATGRVAITNAPLVEIVSAAYEIDPRLQRWVLVGGSDEILNARFDIEAVPPENAASGQQLQMLRRLLAERFGLRVRRETRVLPIYALTVANQGRLGPELRPSAHNCRSFLAAGGRPDDVDAPRDRENRPLCFRIPDFDRLRAGVMTIQNAGPVSELVLEIQPHMERPVVDATGLSGLFEWVTTFAMGLTISDSGYPLLVSALERDLGLKLERRNGPVEVFIIDNVAWPTAN